MRPQLPHFASRLLILIWGVSAFCVWVWSTQYQFSSDFEVTQESIQNWPSESDLKLAIERPTLVFFLHPRCPCTRASLRELERILTGSGLSENQQPRCIVVISMPTEAGAEWRDSETAYRASSLPQTETVYDTRGIEARRFGVTASGAALLFHPQGRLLFSGGVTASRGHEGDNVGSDRLYALLSNQTELRQSSTPVFGCRLCLESEPSDCSEVCHSNWRSAGFVATGAKR